MGENSGNVPTLENHRTGRGTRGWVGQDIRTTKASAREAKSKVGDDGKVSPEQPFAKVEACRGGVKHPGPVAKATRKPRAKMAGKNTRPKTEKSGQRGTPRSPMGGREGRWPLRPMVIMVRGRVGRRAIPRPGHDLRAMQVTDIRQGSDLEKLAHVGEAQQIITPIATRNEAGKKEGVIYAIGLQPRKRIMKKNAARE